jgi:hypothetical protein
MNQRTKKTVKPKRGGAGKKRAKAGKTPELESEKSPLSFIIEWERAHKLFHEEIDDAMERAYKCHPGCRGFGRCEWSMRALHVLDLKQFIGDVTRVIKKFCRGNQQRGKKQTELVRKAIQIKSKNKGRTCGQILADEHPDWDEWELEIQRAEIKRLRANLRKARQRTKARDLKKRGSD